MGRYLVSAASCASAILFMLAEIAQLCLCANSSIPCIERESQALLQFKASLSDPSNWLSSWEGVHCCQWEGIGFDNLTGHVVKLDLAIPYWKCLRSEPFRSYECEYLYNHYVEAPNVNPSLQQLEYLTYLDLTGNNFNYSPIPMFIASMQRLNYLSLSGARFGGIIPSGLGNLTNLHFLDLSLNNFNYSPIPMFSASMQRLNYLSLSGARFGGRIPSGLGNLTNLHFLDLSWSDFSQTGDINWISGLRSLEHLDMSGVYLGKAHNLFQVLNMLPSNLLSVQLDWCGLDSLFSHVNLTIAPKLQVLSLAVNELTVSVLDALQNMTSLVHLDLSSNNLTSVASWFGKFEKLKHLDLSYNGFRGPVSNAIRNMASIEYLDLSGNYFTSVPSWFIELKTLRYLDLSVNKLTSMECSLSSILINICHLKFLILSGNKLHEESLGRNELSAHNRYDLKYMDLRGDKFNGCLPSWLSQLENLKHLSLSENFFSGPIPFSFRKLTKLRELDLSNNKFEGALPNNMGQFVNLHYLDLSNNYLNGTIPQSFGQLVNLIQLDLSNNYLNGTVPQSFDQLVKLEFLNLSSNNLDGTITWSSIKPYLLSLDLAYNQISGSLPKHIGLIMPHLEVLLLGNNLINGSIPNSLCQTELINLDLSKNRFSGEIPDCWNWKDSIHLEEINFSFNKLSGVFPISFGDLSSLLWLHLNNNNLQGELPVLVRNLKQLLILDVGENKLSGSIPSWTANTFPLLQILRLRQNMLSGNIPSQLCQMSSLKILDLSCNNLQGSIPWCIGNLQGMILNMSSNESTRELALLRADLQWSIQDVKEVMKGREFDYIKILKLVVIMDFSKNNLVGSIPEGITLLTGLHGLNLSNNHLKGGIPKMIGDMKSLESFDVSNNQLSGTIPTSMPALTSLSYLNLSHNNFSGPIPKDNEFLTYDPSIYAGNPYLCGLPLKNKCPSDDSHQLHGSKESEDEDGKTDKLEKWWFYFVVAVGFAIGFWGVIGALLFKKSWRHAYFKWVEDAADMIYVAIAIKVAKLKMRMTRNIVHG